MDVLDKIKASKPNIDKEELELIREIIKAKDMSQPIAGTVKTGESGEWNNMDNQKPVNQIHEFKNLGECVCDCHLIGKIDCEKCYDHPKHLENFKRPTL